MPYLVNLTTNPPHFKLGRLVDFEAKVPSVNRRVEVSQIFTDGLAMLDPDETPEHLALDNAVRKTLPDMFRSGDGVCVVSRALRDLLEGMDPGLHQFLPLTLDGAPPLGERYILNVCVKQDSVVVEETKARPFVGDRRESLLRVSAFVKDRDVVIDTRRLGTANAWRERQLRGALLVSDALREDVVRQKLRVLPLVKCATFARGEGTLH